jgi:photosystem II stability/assembly factor-like uncharacterized protein
VTRLAAAAGLLALLVAPPIVLHSPPPGWTPLSSGVTARLRGLSAVSPRVVWASGTAGTIIRTQDGGTTWLRSTIPGAGALDFRDIDGIDERTAYVLSIGDGDASRIYKTSDAGQSWTLQFTNTDKQAFFDAMAFRDARHGFAFSDSVDGRLVIIRTDDGGGHWARISGGLPPALENEGAFAASGSNIAVLGDRIWIATSKSRVIRSQDDGRTWSVAATPLPAGASAGIFSIAFATGDRGIVVGGDYKAEAAAVDNAALSQDGGLTWTLVKGLGGYRSAVGYIAASAAAREAVIAVGPGGSDYSSDGGRSWSPISGAGFHTLSVIRGTRIVWAAGENGAIAWGEF